MDAWIEICLEIIPVLDLICRILMDAWIEIHVLKVSALGDATSHPHGCVD